jgi:hypothetical protein
MRSISDTEVLIAALLVVALCVLLNLQLTYSTAGWACERALALLSQAATVVW